MYIMASNPSRYEQMENVRQCRPGQHGGERMNATGQNGLRTINKIYCILYSYRIFFLHYIPESKEDFHDAVEVADVPGLLCGAQDAAEDGAARGGVARLRDHQVHDPLTHLLRLKQG